jgi:hypothetical protein
MQKNGPRPWIVVVCAALLLIVSCRTKNVEPPTPAEMVSLSVAPVNLSIAPGTAVQFTATGTFADNSKRNVTASVTWNSSDTGIAIISNTGLATASTTTGSAIISAVSGGITGTTALTISHVSSIAVTPTSPPCIAPGTTQQFSATGTLADGTGQNLTSFATWTSSDTGIATVSNSSDSKGLATAIAPGIANIEATYDNVSSSGSLSSSAVASLEISPIGTSIPKGTTQQFAAIGMLSGGCNTQDVTSLATWTTSNTTVATVGNALDSKGLTTAVNIGSATISATIDSVPSSSATLTVTPAVLTSIALSPLNPSIALGKTQQFIATGIFSDSTTLDLSSLVTWSSSDAGIATISNTSGSRGLATSIAEGMTSITAIFSGTISDISTLTVAPAQLVSITITPSSANIFIHNNIYTQQFTATGTFTDGSSQDLTTSVNWVSMDKTVATISNAPGSEGLATVPLNVSPPVSTTINATVSGITSNSAVLIVNF